MKTNLTKSFEVPQKTELIWNHLIDPTKIMDCVPGVSIDEKVGENHYKGKVGMKFGPMGVKYEGIPEGIPIPEGQRLGGVTPRPIGDIIPRIIIELILEKRSRS
mgnify:CR=1 FL=1